MYTYVFFKNKIKKNNVIKGGKNSIVIHIYI